VSFGILYESTLAKGPEMVVEATPPVVYERVHFIGHAVYDATITADSMRARAKDIEDALLLKTGKKVFVVKIMVKQYSPSMTDVDFVLDVPSSSPIAGTLLVGIITGLASLLVAIVWLFWTVYSQTTKKYYCDQETPPSIFDNWSLYLAHLEEKHPAKYSAIEQAGSSNWWEGPSLLTLLLGGAIAATAITVGVVLVRGDGR